MNKKLPIKSIALIFSLSLLVSGCASLQSAYDKSVSTVAGWFGSDEAEQK